MSKGGKNHGFNVVFTEFQTFRTYRKGEKEK